MAIGVWTYTTMNTALNEIESGKDEYYKEQRLGDAFASVSQIPKTAVKGLEEIKGIKQAEGRIVKDIRVLLPENKKEVIRLRAISTVIGENDTRLNAYVNNSGNDLSASWDVLIGADFYNAFGYEPGDSIRFLVDRRTYDFTVQGSIYSPEYVYIVENQGDLFSDTTKFNIAYMDEKKMMSMFGMEGVYNDLSFTFDDGYTYDDVRYELERELNKY